MSMGQKLIAKTLALAQKVKRHAPDYEKFNLQAETLYKSNGGKRLILDQYRRDDANFGNVVVGNKIKTQTVIPTSATLATSGSVIEMTLSDASAVADFQIEVGDLVEIMTASSTLYQQVIPITEILSAHTFLLEASGVGFTTENNISVRLMQHSVVPSWGNTPSEQD